MSDRPIVTWSFTGGTYRTRTESTMQKTPQQLRAEARELHKQAQCTILQAEALEDLGAEPPVGTVIAFRHSFHGRLYDYAVLSCGRDRWYTTGPKGGAVPRTWTELCGFIGSKTQVQWINRPDTQGVEYPNDGISIPTFGGGDDRLPRCEPKFATGGRVRQSLGRTGYQFEVLPPDPGNGAISKGDKVRIKGKGKHVVSDRWATHGGVMVLLKREGC